MEAQRNKELKELRSWREKHWGKTSTHMRVEAEELKEKTVILQHNEYKSSINRVYAEWDEREFARARMQVEAPITAPNSMLPSGRSLGIFGAASKPTGPRMNPSHALLDIAEDAEEIFAEDYSPDVDYHEVHVFDSQPQTDYEDNVNTSLDISSILQRNEQLYNTLQNESKSLDQAMNRMIEMRGAVERDMVQLHTEMGVEARELLGPPRRLPFPNETETTKFQMDKKIITEQKKTDNKKEERIAEKERKKRKEIKKKEKE